MKLQCSKCSKPLTTDMYPVKVNWVNNKSWSSCILNLKDIFTLDKEVFEDDNGEDHTVYSLNYMKGGLFYMSKPTVAENNKYDENLPAQILRKHPSMIVVGEPSILPDIIPPYYTGCGCCNHSMGDELTCECGNTLGKMYLDCYEGKDVEFYPKKVRRVYK